MSAFTCHATHGALLTIRLRLTSFVLFPENQCVSRLHLGSSVDHTKNKVIHISLYICTCKNALGMQEAHTPKERHMRQFASGVM